MIPQDKINDRLKIGVFHKEKALEKALLDGLKSEGYTFENLDIFHEFLRKRVTKIESGRIHFSNAFKFYLDYETPNKIFICGYTEDLIEDIKPKQIRILINVTFF